MPKHLPAAMLLGCGSVAVLLAGCTTGSGGNSPNGTSSTQVSTPNTPTSSPSTADLSSAAPTVVAPTTGAASSGQPSGSGATETSAAKTVPVHITIGSWNAQSGEAQVDAFVPGHVIRGGSCTLSLSQGDTTRQASHPAVTTPTATSCGLISIPRSELSAGTWSAVVRFSAPTATGTSDPVSIQVPA